MIIFSTKVHGYLDYLMGIVLLIVPALLQLDRDSAEGMILYVLGTILIFYSAFTNYELGIIKVIPMKMHLTLDIFSGIFLATAPWVLDFENQVCIPFVILGVTEIAVGLTTTSKKAPHTSVIQQSTYHPTKTSEDLKKSIQTKNKVVKPEEHPTPFKKTVTKPKKLL